MYLKLHNYLTHDCGKTSEHPLIVEKVKDSQHHCFHCCYVRCTILLVAVEGMSWPKTGANHHHARLELQDNGRVFKKLLVYSVIMHFTGHIQFRDSCNSDLNGVSLSYEFIQILYTLCEVCSMKLTRTESTLTIAIPQIDKKRLFQREASICNIDKYDLIHKSEPLKSD